jgi:hypothetical protein
MSCGHRRGTVLFIGVPESRKVIEMAVRRLHEPALTAPADRRRDGISRRRTWRDRITSKRVSIRTPDEISGVVKVLGSSFHELDGDSERCTDDAQTPDSISRSNNFEQKQLLSASPLTHHLAAGGSHQETLAAARTEKPQPSLPTHFLAFRVPNPSALAPSPLVPPFKKYYPVREVSGGFQVDLGGTGSTLVPGPSGIFLRLKYDPATFARTLNWIVAYGPDNQGGVGSKYGLPDTAIDEFVAARRDRLDFGGLF